MLAIHVWGASIVHSEFQAVEVLWNSEDSPAEKKSLDLALQSDDAAVLAESTVPYGYLFSGISREVVPLDSTCRVYGTLWVSLLRNFQRSVPVVLGSASS